MEKSKIKVDYEWALEEVTSSHDFSNMSPSYVKSYVDGWCEGFLKGYILGCIESAIESIVAMRRVGLSPEQIEKYTGVSSQTIIQMK